MFDLVLERVDSLTLVEKAGRKMSELADENAAVISNSVAASLTYSSDDLNREVSAWYDEKDTCLYVDYHVWKDYPVKGREEDVRFSKQDIVAEIPDSPEEVEEAVRDAYQKSREVTEGDLGQLSVAEP